MAHNRKSHIQEVLNQPIYFSFVLFFRICYLWVKGTGSERCRLVGGWVYRQID